MQLPLNKCNLSQMNAYLSTLGEIGSLKLEVSSPCVIVSVENFSPLLTHALIKLEPKDCISPSNHAMNAEMHECRSFKIIVSRLKRGSS